MDNDSLNLVLQKYLEELSYFKTSWNNANSHFEETLHVWVDQSSRSFKSTVVNEIKKNANRIQVQLDKQFEHEESILKMFKDIEQKHTELKVCFENFQGLQEKQEKKMLHGKDLSEQTKEAANRAIDNVARAVKRSKQIV